MKLASSLLVAAMMFPAVAAADWYSSAIAAIDKARTVSRQAIINYRAGNFALTARFSRRTHNQINVALTQILSVNPSSAPVAFFSARANANSNCGFADANTGGLYPLGSLQATINSGNVDIVEQLRSARRYLAACRLDVIQMNQP